MVKSRVLCPVVRAECPLLPKCAHFLSPGLGLLDGVLLLLPLLPSPWLALPLFVSLRGSSGLLADLLSGVHDLTYSYIL